MFQIKPTQKQISKYFKTDDSFICPKSWVEFAELTSIRSAGNIVKFNPYKYQVDLVQTMIERSVCIVKSRQLGISETIISFMLWNACLNPGYMGLVFSKTQTDSSLLARRMKRMIESLGLSTTTENLSDIEIKGKGRILFRNSNPDSARGIESVCMAFLDEFSFQENAEDIYNALAPSMQMLGDKARVYAVSTPNGKTGMFYNLAANNNGSINLEYLCEKVSKGEIAPYQSWVDNGGWGKVLLHWKVHPIYGNNPNFLKEVHENQKLSWDVIEREYNLQFSDASTSVFDSALIRKNAVGNYENDYDANAQYYAGLDTATTGNDYCVFPVLKFKNNLLSLVHLYRKRKETSDYHLYHIGELIKKFHIKGVGIETTGGVGQVYLESLCKEFKRINIEAIRTTGDSKPVMISNLQLVLERQQFIYPNNSPLVDELLSFRRQGRKLEATSGKHDDIVIGCDFGIAIRPLFKEIKLGVFGGIQL
ncbi:MAG: terminase family protein [Cyanobacteria bacterium J06633_8]